jgi:hypothetical protein
MLKYLYFFNLLKKIAPLLLLSLLLQCSEDESILTTEQSIPDVDISATSTTTTSPTSCASCTYVVPGNVTPGNYNTVVVDGKALGLKPGAVICLSAANKYRKIHFINIVGTATTPITITNCGGTATVNSLGDPYTIKTQYSKYFRISGGTGTNYGIKVLGGHMGLSMEALSTNFEINNVEIYNVGFAGIIAKTDPSCDNASSRENFVMRDVSLHNNYIHDTGGEAMYVGNSFYETGMPTACGVRLPHTVDGVKIYNNKIINPGWEAIQVGCALTGAYVYNNHIENYGVKNVAAQTNGIQFSQGTKGIAYNNFIKGGKGIGINVIGYGDSFLHNNVIIGAGTFGIFCDERTSRAAGFRILNNTIIDPGQDGIRMYNKAVPAVVYNNIIVNPGNYSKYVYPRTGMDAYVYKLGKDIPITIANNLFTRDISTVKFTGPATFTYELTSSSPAVNKGINIAAYNIPLDFYQHARLSGSAYDIGASELIGPGSDTPPVDGTLNTPPTANAGRDMVVYLPSNAVIVKGSGTDTDGSISSYQWTKIRGPVAGVLSGTSSPTLSASKLVAGAYVFRLTVKDNKGQVDTDDMLVKVN